MKPMTSKVLIFFAVLFAIANGAMAQQGVQIGDPEMKGSGCPPGTARATVSPDGTAISILFDQFSIEVPRRGEYPESKLRRTCYFKIPVLSVPQGMMIVASRIDYRGYAQHTKQSEAYIKTAGPMLNPMQNEVNVPPITSYLPPGDDLFTITHKIKPNFLTAKCKKGRTLEFSTEIRLQSYNDFRPNFMLEDAMLVLDTADIGGPDVPIEIGIQLKNCKD